MLKSLIFLLILHHSFGANLQRLKLQNDPNSKVEPVSFQKLEKNPEKNTDTKISFVENEETNISAEKFDVRKDVEKISSVTRDKTECTKKEVKEEGGKKEAKEESGKKEAIEETGKKEAKEESGKKEAKEESGKKEAKEEPVKKEVNEVSGKKEAKEESGKKEANGVSGKKEAKEESGKKEAKDETGKKEAKEETGKKEAKEEIGKKEGQVEFVKKEEGAAKVEATSFGATNVGTVPVGSENVKAVKDGVTPVVVSKGGAIKLGPAPNGSSKVGFVPLGATKIDPVKPEASKVENVHKDFGEQQVVPIKEEVGSLQKEPIAVKDVREKMPKPSTPVVEKEEAKNSSNDEKSAGDDEGAIKNNDEDTGISKFSFLRRLEQTCQVGNDHGVCVSNIFECKNTGSGSVVLGGSGGWISNGGCSSYTCCEVHQTCGGHDSKKVTYFTNPNSNQARDPCVYTINAMNSNICQVRIDFVYFSISPASQQPNSPFSPILCRDDSFDVITPNGFKAPTLCGYNAGQHMYIPLNASNNETMLQLRFRLAPRGGNSILQEPQWKIKVTQLECPHNNLYAMQNSEKDAQMVAPTGCLQYFTERTGTVCNFGYNPQLPQMSNFYVTNMKYSMCFKRAPDACGILFRSPQNKFNLSNNSPDCTEGDYVFIPEGQMVTGGAKTLTNSRFCTNSINTATEVISTYSGPFSIQFSSDKVSDPSIENGFCLEYQAPPPTCY